MTADVDIQQLAQDLQRNNDRHAIEDVLQRYCRTQDWLDDDGQMRCFWPDADIDYGFFKGTGAEFVTTVMEHERTVQRRWHMSTGAMIDLRGDRANVETYGIAVGGNEGEGFTMYGGRYLDEFEKRSGEWRISKRTYILDWSNTFPDTLAENTGEDFALHILQIREGGHPMYRTM